MRKLLLSVTTALVVATSLLSAQPRAAQQIINLTPGNGDTLPAGGAKINNNFTEIYGKLVEDGPATSATLRTLGTGPLQAAPGADSVQKGSVTTNGQTINGPRLLGRVDAGSGALQEIPLGSNVAFSGGQLVGTVTPTTDASALTTGTLNAMRLPNSGVTPGTYGTSTQVPRVTVDTYGRVTAATTVTVSAPTGYLLSAITASNTAEQNRVALLADIKSAISNRQGLYLSCGGECAVGEIEVRSATNNSTTAALGEGQKLHLMLDESTVIKTQVGQKFLDVDLSDGAVTMAISGMTPVNGTNTVSTTVSDPPFFHGRYLRLTVPDAMVNAAADPTTVVNKFDQVTLQDDTPQINNEDGVNEGFQAEDFEVLEVVEVAGTADDYVYISVPLKTYNPATSRLHLWRNKDTEFSVTGGRFKGDPATGDFESKTLTRATTTSIVFDVNGVKGPIFRDIRVSDTFTGFAQIQHSMLLRVDNVQGERARNQSTPSSPDYRALSYMFDLYGANKNFSITNSGGNGWRHVFTTNHAQATTYSATSWPLYGETVGGHLDGYRGTFNQGGSIDTHDPSYGLTISNAIIQSPVEYSDGIISPRCLSDRAATTTYRNIQCYGAFSLLTMDGWRLDHKNADNVTTIQNASYLHPMHIPSSAIEDLPVIEGNGRAGVLERRKLIANALHIEDFGTILQTAANGGDFYFDNLSIVGDIYRISPTGRAGFVVASGNKLTIKNTTLDFRTANVIDNTLAVNNALIKAFGSLAGDSELTLENVTILGCSKFDNGTTRFLFSNDGTGTKTVRFRNFYCDDPDVVISGGAGLTMVNMGPASTTAGSAPGITSPANHAMLDWNFPPIAASVNPSTAASQIYAARLRFGAGGTIAGVKVTCVAAGTSTDVRFAIHDLNGNRLGMSANVQADFSSCGNSTDNTKTVPMSAAITGLPAGSELIVTYLAVGGTAPRLASGSQQAGVHSVGQNTTLGSQQLRQFFTYANGSTAIDNPLPAPVTTISNVAFFVGIY